MPRYINAEHFEESLDLMCDAGGILQPITEVVRQFCKDKIRLEPTADVQEVRHGRWEYIRDVALCWVCSECAYYVLHEYKFCPHCGAKMDLEDGDEDATNR